MMLQTANHAWVTAYNATLIHGDIVTPRGIATRELLHQPHRINMRYPVVTVASRKLNYRFMAAEALWILKGQNTLAELMPYNARMAEFSDDGVTLAGAYGPRIAPAIDYVVATLERDVHSRQAAFTIWQPNPAPSKDIPCTIAMTITIRNMCLNVHVFMRSSDIWLGLPYDIFAFATIGYTFTAKLKRTYPDLVPGFLYITAASSHLYTHDVQPEPLNLPFAVPKPTPDALWQDNDYLLDYLATLRDSKKDSSYRWWNDTDQL